MYSHVFLTLSVIAVLIASSSAQLVVVQSGINGRIGPTLTNDSVLCPESFSKKGISIECIPSNHSNSATFYVNGKLFSADDEKPFHIKGTNDRGQIRPWTEYEESSNITCLQDDGTRSAIVNATFSCGMPVPIEVPQPRVLIAPGEMVFYEAGIDGVVGPRVFDGMTFCPSMFHSGAYSIRCAESANSTYGLFFIDGVERRRENVVPYFINGDFDGDVAPLVNMPDEFNVKCQLSDGTTTIARVRIACQALPPGVEPAAPSTPGSVEAPAPHSSGTDCVVMDARSTTLTPWWTETSDGVAYKVNDHNEGVDEPGVPLVYKFTAPVSSQFSFVLDMTTQHITEHNDLWAKFPSGGWVVTRYGEHSGDAQTGFVKVYHNEDGRATIASTIDHNPHSIATAGVLEAGVEYVVQLAGRSTMVTIHRIIMFPCSGTDCERGHSVWQEHMSVCAAL